MIPYRVKQVLFFLQAEPASEDVAWVKEWLSPAEQRLFRTQQLGDQAHAIRVARTLWEQGQQDERLIQAALLHDVGKAPGVPLFFRVSYYFLKKLAPLWLDRLRPAEEGWRMHLARFHYHPQLGAALARAAQSHPDVVTLIEVHQQKDAALPQPLQAMLDALQVVDDAS